MAKHALSNLQMEVALAKYFNVRKYIIVPNASWGLDLHECDLLILMKKSFYATEIEIKRSKADLENDLKKRHGHHSNKIKNLYFAIPAELQEHIGLIPDRAGVVLIHSKPGRVTKCQIVRRAKANTNARPFTREEVNKMLEIGIMRIWKLKEKLSKL